MDNSEKPTTQVVRTGEAPIKKEFLKPRSEIPSQIAAAAAKAKAQTPANDNVNGFMADANGTMNNAFGESQADQKKLKGTFKKRPISVVENPADSLCRAISDGSECPFGDKCIYNHDLKAFMKRKPKDLGPSCPVFDAKGYCRYGLNCRFGKSHIRETGDGQFVNVRAEPLNHSQQIQAQDDECNELTERVRDQLRKNRYPFRSIEPRKGKKHQRRPDRNHKPKQEPSQPQQQEEKETAEAEADPEADKDAVTNKNDVVEPVVESPLLPERKKVDFKRKVYIAPLTTVGNLPYRRLMKQTGADITCGEMAMALNLLRGQQSEWALLRRHKSEDVFGVQLAGGHGDQMARVCELISRETKVDFIDVNMGCPIDIVCRAGAGAALMNRPPKVVEVISGALTGIELGSIGRPHFPGFTVKMRTGWNDKTPVAHKLMPKIQTARASDAWMNASVLPNYKVQGTQWVDAITIHGRSRLQRYTKRADWDYVFECRDAQVTEWQETLEKEEAQALSTPRLLPHIPMIGGGDVLSFEEFDDHLRNGKLETCMLARGALIKPWLPTEIKERRHYDISACERLELLKDFVRFGLEHWGSDQKGVNRTRRYLLEWQSFLCRYIPVGLLERLPQQINDRPCPYYGRNELETLMGSDQAADWIKISEMLLGPVPDGFQFVPKHKANAYVMY